MALPTISEQRLDVYDIITGGDDAYDPAETPVFNMLPNGPDSPQAAKFQFVFDVPDAPSAAGSAEGGQWSQAALTNFGDPSRLYGRMHHQKYLVGAGEVTDGDQGYGMQGLSTFQYQVKKCLRRLIKDAELVCIGSQENQAGSTSTAFKTRGLELYILDTTLIALQTDTDTVIESDFRPVTAQVLEVTTGAGAFAFDEAHLQAMTNAAYSNRQAKIAWEGWVTPRLKTLISNWGNLAPTVGSYTNIRRFNSSADSMTMKTTFQKWIGDAGEVEVDLHPFLRLNTSTQAAEGLFLHKGYQQKRVRKAPSIVKMADDAGVKRAYGMSTFGLQCIPKFNGQVRRAAA
jgi:hypothetical protein